jgi:hypothetical protein
MNDSVWRLVSFIVFSGLMYDNGTFFAHPNPNPFIVTGANSCSAHGDPFAHVDTNNDTFASDSQLSAYCNHHVREQGVWLGDRKSADADV